MPNLFQLDGESNLDFHKRIIYGKLVDKTLADYDYSELSELVYGQKFASDECRKRMYGSKRTLDLISAENITASTPSDVADKITELRIERQKLFDERAALNRSIRAVARQQELSEIIQRAVADGNLPALKQVDRVVSEDDWDECDLLVSLNDIHYGAIVDNHWCKYNSDIAIEMAVNYVDEVIKIAKTHHARNCYVYNCGDSISGSIHRSIQVTNKENVIQQVCGVSELIANFISELAPYFENVYYLNVAGNHSRIEASKKDALIPERLDNLIGWYLDARVNELENVKILNEALIDDTMFMDGAIVARLALPAVPISANASRTPHTVPSRPTIGSRATMVAMRSCMQSCRGTCTTTRLIQCVALSLLWLDRSLVWTNIACRSASSVSLNSLFAYAMTEVSVAHTILIYLKIGGGFDGTQDENESRAYDSREARQARRNQEARQDAHFHR